MCHAPLAMLDTLLSITASPTAYEIPEDFASLAALLHDLQYDPEAIRRAVRWLEAGGSVVDCEFLDDEDKAVVAAEMAHVEWRWAADDAKYEAWCADRI